jgi:hypothetical protein
MPSIKFVVSVIVFLIVLGVVLFFVIAKPTEGKLSEWSEWTKCTPQCGDTCTESRTRKYTPPMIGQKHPEGHDILSESRFVVGKNCPEDGSLSGWSSWTGCEQAKCGSCEETRTRTYRAPLHGGKDVEGYDMIEQKQMARLPQCPVSGVLSAWGPWTGCEKVTCGKCTETRKRTYTQPIHGGEHPVGHNVLGESRDAKKLVCAVTLYTDANYKGKSSTLPVGDYDLDEMGIQANTLSSLKVTPQHIVYLFTTGGSKVPFASYTKDVADLKTLKDRTGSIRVAQVPLLEQ